MQPPMGDAPEHRLAREPRALEEKQRGDGEDREKFEHALAGALAGQKRRNRHHGDQRQGKTVGAEGEQAAHDGENQPAPRPARKRAASFA